MIVTDFKDNEKKPKPMWNSDHKLTGNKPN